MVTLNKDEIIGVNVRELNQIHDSRGAVLHMLRCDSDDFVRFGECYMSEVLPNSVKAWKKHTLQTQNLAVPIGKILLVIFDSRENSQTYGNILKIELGRPNNYKRVTIPPEVWYGFKCISENEALIVNCSDLPHLKQESVVIDTSSNAIPFNW
jgi:dTDP-4-dehydrorhamnose 3,5-epimerase